MKRARHAMAVRRRQVVRHVQNAWQAPNFATWQTTRLLPNVVFRHRTPLFRNFTDVDLALQKNKVKNLQLAAKALDGLRIKPGELFSFWERIGEPSAEHGFVEGLVFERGEMESGIGGGLCQLTNLLYWMFLHVDLNVTERHRHAVDMFPDENREQPFGTGATVFFPFMDLRAVNASDVTFQLHVWTDGSYLNGELRADRMPTSSFRIVEREHRFVETVEGVFRENQIWRVCNRWDLPVMFAEGLVAKNRARVQYALPVEIPVQR